MKNRLFLGTVVILHDITALHRAELALAERARAQHAAGKLFKLCVLTGASSGDSIDEDLARAKAVLYRAPYQSGRALRRRRFDLHPGEPLRGRALGRRLAFLHRMHREMYVPHYHRRLAFALDSEWFLRLVHAETRGALPAPLLEVLAARFTLHTAVDRTVLETLDFGVTRATAGVAETGSVLLTDRDTPDRLAAVATWIHVAVLDPAAIVPGVEEALALAADDPYAVLVTGPSQTADVEGILIRGVHGPGEQVCLLVAPSDG